MKKEIVKTLLATGIGVSLLTTNIYATSSVNEKKAIIVSRNQLGV